MHSTLALSFLALAGFAAAQDQPQLNYPYTINPESVDENLRQYWCQQNQAQCPLICSQLPGVNSQTTNSNECDSDALTYSCVCENGVAPNITQYSQTLPFFICQEWGNQCANNCGGDSACASSCREDHPCGAQDPYKGNATVSSMLAEASKSAASKTGSSDAVPTSGFAGGDDQSDNKSNNNNNSNPGSAAATLGQGAGLAIVVGGLLAGFAML